MEDVLDIYHRPYDPRRPVVCMDETNKQLVGEERTPLPAIPGHPARYDHHYVRKGVAELFLWVEPLTGRCRVHVREHRAMLDWAVVMQQLVEVDFPDAEVITVVMDNLSTHSKSALYQAFPPDRAKQIADRLDLHFTPKHGSWLNIAEILLSVLSRQCLRRRIPSRDQLEGHVSAWEARRNHNPPPVNWQFTVSQARVKLHRLYPANLSSR